MQMAAYLPAKMRRDVIKRGTATSVNHSMVKEQRLLEHEEKQLTLNENLETAFNQEMMRWKHTRKE